MSGRILFDTNIIVDLFAEVPAVLRMVEVVEEVFVPSIVIGELLYGAQKSLRREENLDRIREFAKLVTIVGVDMDVAETYGRIKNHLRAKGRLIPENDIWIAAIAQTHDL